MGRIVSQRNTLSCRTLVNEHDELIGSLGSLPSRPDLRSVRESISFGLHVVRKLYLQFLDINPTVTLTSILMRSVVLYFGWVLDQKFNVCVFFFWVSPRFSVQ